jgi:hypothetical protein
MVRWMSDDPLPEGELWVWLNDPVDDHAAPDARIHVTTTPAVIALVDPGVMDRRALA